MTAIGRKTTRSYLIRGVVQGVGFRPTVKRVADEVGLSGYVQNTSAGVRLVTVGTASQSEDFWRKLPDRLGLASKIEYISEEQQDEKICLTLAQGFEVRDSEVTDAFELSIPADLAICPDCRCEISDPDNRRYGYPFTTCINCGPRYTVVNDLPYDRSRTTMSNFDLCPACREEYHDPLSRRFHAESIACPECGPALRYFDAGGCFVDTNPLEAARRDLNNGRIVAVRGIGGFLLAVNALDVDAVSRLRRRKLRPDKPLALMARSLEVVRRYCQLEEAEVQLICAPAAPIVILDIKPGNREPLPIGELCPDSMTLGFMLPYSPLHWFLFNPLIGDKIPAFDLLVMTSGNRHSEPICLNEEEAFRRLEGIADSYLSHNRDINLRADDSLLVVRNGRRQLWRRARGFAPDAINLGWGSRDKILALGAEQKNSIGILTKDKLYLSPHIGDLTNSYACQGFEKVISQLSAFLKCQPTVIAVDLHPEYYSTRVGQRLSSQTGAELIGVQHHYAHAVSCMVDNNVKECLALVFDGTGYGPDQTFWGAELLACDMSGFKRLGTFKEVRLPGGDAAVRDPRRQLVARLYEYGIKMGATTQKKLALSEMQIDSWQLQIEKKINSPLSHGAGRLFDSIAVMLGVMTSEISYEGQPAVRLESAARRCSDNAAPELPFCITTEDGLIKVGWQGAFEMLTEIGGRYDPEQWAYSFHASLAKAAVVMIEHCGVSVGSRSVCLSGGVFMNRLLTEMVVALLKERGISSLIHSDVPPNDGGISVGQAAVAGWGGK